MIDDISKTVESSPSEQKPVDMTESTEKIPESIQPDKEFSLEDLLAYRKPYKFDKKKMTKIIQAIKILIVNGTGGIEPPSTLKLLQKDLKINARDGYIYLDKTDVFKKNINWVRIAIYDEKAMNCVLMEFNKDSGDWDECGKGSLPICLKNADLLFAKEMNRTVAMHQPPNDVCGSVGETSEPIDSVETGPVVLSETNINVLNESLLKKIKPYVFSTPEMEKILNIVLNTIEKLPNLKGSTGISTGNGYIALHNLVNSKNGFKWAQINMHNEDCSDCELILYKKGRTTKLSYTKGTLIDCLESAETASYFL